MDRPSGIYFQMRRHQNRVCEVNKDEGREIDNPMTAIEEWQVFPSDEELTDGLKQCSALPQPMDLAGISTAEEQRRKLARAKVDSVNPLDRHVKSGTHSAKAKSIMSFATGMSSGFEN